MKPSKIWIKSSKNESLREKNFEAKNIIRELYNFHTWKKNFTTMNQNKNFFGNGFLTQFYLNKIVLCQRLRFTSITTVCQCQWPDSSVMYKFNVRKISFRVNGPKANDKFTLPSPTFQVRFQILSFSFESYVQIIHIQFH